MSASCMYTPAERLGQAVVVMVGLIFAIAVGGFILRGGPVDVGIGASPTPAASPTTKAPDVKFTQDTCCTQTARSMRATWESSEKVQKAAFQLVPDPGFPCATSLDPSGMKGVLSCQGLIRGATDYTATLSLTAPASDLRRCQRPSARRAG